MGIAFLVFFSVTHKIGLFSPKIEVIPNAMAHLLITKNLSNQPTAPANRELGEQEKGRESLAVACRWRQHQQRWRWRKEWRRCTARQRRSDCSSVDAAAGEARWWCAARRSGLWEQRGGCSGFTGTVHEWANTSAFERHRLADVRVFVLGRGRRDNSVDGIVIIATMAAPMATSTVVADAPPLLTTTPMATPTTLFVELNLIYYYYLFIYHYVDRK